MNILTFDIEEWYIEKTYHSDGAKPYQTYDYYLKSILDLLDERNLRATFFCVGGLAKEFPHVVRLIADRGHEIGCHSNTHVWLSTMDRIELKIDTEIAIKSLEYVIGKKVLSYRAPAFSIGERNKWALEVLLECGIEHDASIYPAVRDFGGFAGFPADKPCIVKVGGATLKEFPIHLTTICGHHLAYSGGGYFRFFPMSFIKDTMEKSDYTMTYFHINDIMHHKMHMDSREFYENYFKQPGTFKNRFIRMFKRSIGTKDAFEKMCDLVRTFDFVNLGEAEAMVDWSKAELVEL